MDSGIKYIEFEKKKLTLGLHVPNLTPIIKYMKSSTFESISPTYMYLIWVDP